MSSRSPVSRQCTRFHLDGTRCENRTTAVDGWCRTDGCPGYIQPHPLRDENEPDRAPHGTRKHIAETGSVPVHLDIDEIDGVRVSQRARDSFRYHHRGSDQAAEAQLRSMLEDFLVRSARRKSPNGYTVLSRDGYNVILDDAMTTVTGYGTVHRERTWEQVKAGVPSRFGKRMRPRREPPPLAGPVLPPESVAGAIDADRVHLTSRVRTSYGAVRGLRDADEDTLDSALRTELRAATAGAQVGPRCDEKLVELVAADLTWLVTRDGLTAVGVRSTRAG